MTDPHLLARRIGEQIAALRKSKNLTQTDLAALVDMLPPRISLVESAASSPPTLRTLVRLADALGCTLDVRFIPR